MGTIILLIILGMLLVLVEMLLLPGITIAGIGALVSCGIAVYKAFTDYGNAGGLIALGAILMLSILVAAIALRAKTWRKFTLKNEIDSTSQELPEQEVKIGDTGVAATRLAPMGKVLINGKTYEAKALDAYVDPGKAIEVIGFENFSIIVKISD